MKYLFNTTLLVCLLLFVSCNTSKKILYFQDITADQNMPIAEASEITIQPKDLISIIVSSRDAQLAALFNLPKVSYQVGNAQLNEGASNETMGYTVDAEGNIEFPVLGVIPVKGLTRKQLSDKVKKQLLDENLIKDPVVTVDFMNLKVSVLGEVKSPGKYRIDRDQITILEAISMAGDLTIYGKREGVLVIREANGNRITYKMDLRSSNVFSSPAFYLQQNDVVYVEPNNVRAGQSTVNENNVKSVSLWISVASFLTTLGVLVFK